MGIPSCPPLKDTPGPVAIYFAPDFFLYPHVSAYFCSVAARLGGGR